MRLLVTLVSTGLLSMACESTAIGNIVSFDYNITLNDAADARRFEFELPHGADGSRTRTADDVLGSPAYNVELVQGPPSPPALLDPIVQSFGTLQITSSGADIDVTLNLATGMTGIADAMQFFGGTTGWTITLSDFRFTSGDFIENFVFSGANVDSTAPGAVVDSVANTLTFTLDDDSTTSAGTLGYRFSTTAGSTAAVPEPSTFAVILLGCPVAFYFGRRRRMKEKQLNAVS